MADEQLIKPRELPPATAVFADDAIMTDDGVTVAKATPVQIVDAGAPIPSQSEAIAGVNNSKRMTPLTVRQVLDNTSAPAVLRAQAWAESTTAPDPSMPGSKSSRTWALEAAQSAEDAEDAASTAATDTANLITATMQGYVDSASGSASAAATSEGNAAISAGQAAAVVAGSVRFDQAQTLTSGQKQQARANIAASSKGEGAVIPLSGASAVDIENIPAWVSEVKLMVFNVSTAADSSPVVRLGSATTLYDTGYTSNAQTSTTPASGATGLIMVGGVATDGRIGIITLQRFANNRWVYSMVARASSSFVGAAAGISPDMDGPLSRIRVNTGSTFDDGFMLVRYS